MPDSTLMGWNPLQRSIDQSSRKTDKLIGTIDKLIKHLGDVAKASAKAGAGGFMSVWRQPASPAGALGNVSAIQAMYGGKGLGGHGKAPGSGYGTVPIGPGGQQVQASYQGGRISSAGKTVGVQQPAASLLAQSGNGGHGAPQGGGGGGSHPSYLSQYGNGGLGRRVASNIAYLGAAGVLAGASRLKSFGDDQMQTQMLMELGARSASFSSGMPYADATRIYRNQVFGRSGSLQQSATSFSATDAMAAEAMRMRVSGGFAANTPRDIAVDQAWRSLAMVNPTLSGEQAAGTMADLLSPRVQSNARWLGMGSLYDKNNAYIGNAELMKRLFRTTFGTSKASPQRVSASLSQGQALFHNMSQLGIGAETFGTLSEYARAYSTATTSGLSGEQLDQLLVRAAGSGGAAKDAQATLKRFNVPVDTLLQKKKEAAAVDRAADSALHDEFIRNWKDATDEVVKWKIQMSELREDNTFKKILSFSGALAEFWNNPGAALNRSFNMTFSGTESRPFNVGGPYGLLGANNPSKRSTTGNAVGLLLGGLPGLFLGGRVGDMITDVTGSGSMQNQHMTGQQAGTDDKPSSVSRLDQIHSMLTNDPPSISSPAEKSAKEGKKTSDKTDKTGKKNRNRADKERNDAPSGGGINSVISYARAQIGKWYGWGMEGPDRFDCSGLTWAAYKYGAHREIGRTTWDQMGNPKGQRVPISRKAVRPGDLIFTNRGGHVVMWTGGGYVSAPQTGKKIHEVAGWPSGIVGIRRFLKTTDRGYNGTGVGVGESSPGEDTLGMAPAETGGDEASGDPVTGNVITGLGNSLGSIEEKDIFEAIFGQGGKGGGSLHSTIGGKRVAVNEDATPEGKAGKGGKVKKKPKGKGGKLPPLPKNTSARSNIKLGEQMAATYGWTDANDQWDALLKLWTKESNWNHLAQNPGSGAYGIPQSMPGRKMASEGPDWRTNPATQIRWGLKYIRGRYGSPQQAWDHWQSRVPISGKDVGHWYDKGAWEIKSDTKAVVHKGEMIIPSKQADTIRDVLTRENVTSAGRLTQGGRSITFGPNSMPITVNVHGGGGGGASFDTHAAARQLARQLKIELAQLDSYEATARGR